MNRILLCLAFVASLVFPTMEGDAASVMILVNAAPSLSCSYTPVTTGTQGTAYTGATPSASNGTPSYTFSETGTLPTGVSISSSTGIISGTPSVSGSFGPIQVSVTDSASHTANCGSAFTLVISPSAPTIAYINKYSPTYSGNVASATATIPAAASNTLVVVVYYDVNNGYVGPASSTINSVAATINTQGPIAAFENLGIASALVTAGTTSVPISVTYNSSPGGFGQFVVYTVTGLSSTTPVGANNNYIHGATSSPISTTVATTSGGVVIAGALQDSATGLPTFSGTETYTTDNGFTFLGGMGAGAAHASGVATNASSTVTATFAAPIGTNNALISAVSFR